MEDSKPYFTRTIHHNHSSIYRLMSANYVSNTVCLARVEFPSPPEILSGSQHYLHRHGEGSGGTDWQLVSGGLWGSKVRPPNPARPTVCSDFLLTVKFHQNRLRMESASVSRSPILSSKGTGPLISSMDILNPLPAFFPRDHTAWSHNSRCLRINGVRHNFH